MAVTITPDPDYKYLTFLRPTTGKVSILLFIDDDNDISSILDGIKSKISFVDIDIDTGFRENGVEFIRGGIELVDINGQKVAQRTQQVWWKGPGIYFLTNLTNSIKYDDRNFGDFYRALYSLKDSAGERVSHFPVNETKLFAVVDNEEHELLLKRFRELRINNPFQIIDNRS